MVRGLPFKNTGRLEIVDFDLLVLANQNVIILDMSRSLVSIFLAFNPVNEHKMLYLPTFSESNA